MGLNPLIDVIRTSTCRTSTQGVIIKQSNDSKSFLKCMTWYYRNWFSSQSVKEHLKETLNFSNLLCILYYEENIREVLEKPMIIPMIHSVIHKDLFVWKEILVSRSFDLKRSSSKEQLSWSLCLSKLFVGL